MVAGCSGAGEVERGNGSAAGKQTANDSAGKRPVGGTKREGGMCDVTRATDPDTGFVGAALIAREYALGGDRVAIGTTSAGERGRRESTEGTAKLSSHEERRAPCVARSRRGLQS